MMFRGKRYTGWCMFVVALSAVAMAALPAAAQKIQTNINPGLAGSGDEFEIDGSLELGDDPLGLGNGVNDWTSLFGDGSDTFVITAPDKGLNKVIPDGRMVWLVDAFDRDEQTAFIQGTQVDHDPNGMLWAPKKPPKKDDMNNCMVWLFTDDAGDLWAAMAADRKFNKGAAYLDFEFLKEELRMVDPACSNCNGTFESDGLAGGRTVGDILATIVLFSGGAQAGFILQQWEEVGMDKDGIVYGYVDVTPDILASEGNVAGNILENDPSFAPFSVFGDGTGEYEPFQFGETAINLTALMDLTFCEGIKTLFIRTKTTGSGSGTLKDFCPPIPLTICMDTVDPVFTDCNNNNVLCENADTNADGSISQSELDAVVAGLCTPTVTDDSDICEGPITPTVVVTFTPDCGATGTIKLVWTAVDRCGNDATLEQFVDIIDLTDPTINDPADSSAQCDETAPTFTLPTPNDNCPGVRLVLVSDTGRISDCGDTWHQTKVWKAVDACGRESGLSSQTISVIDTINPTINDPADSTVQCPNVPTFTLPTPSDTCPGVQLVLVSDTGRIDDCGDTWHRTKVWKAVDACGNESGPSSQTIRVIDTINPTINDPADSTVQCPNVPTFTLPTPSDSCPGVQLVLVSDTGRIDDCGDTWHRTKVWKAVDACGNESGLSSQTITVIDTLKPTVTCSDNLMISCSDPLTGVFGASASDLCDTDPDIVLVATGLLAEDTFTDNGDGTFDIMIAGTNTVTITATATDECGNVSDSCSFDVTAECPPVCDGSKPVTLTMIYNGLGCGATSHTQDPSKVSCVGDANEDPSVYIHVQSKSKFNNPSKDIFFEGTVALNASYTIVADWEDASRTSLVGDTAIFIWASEAAFNADTDKDGWIEKVVFHTSCSQPLLIGDQYGSNMLVGFSTQFGTVFPTP